MAKTHTETLSILNSLNVHLVNINESDVKKYNLAPKFWRFLPILENNIDREIIEQTEVHVKYAGYIEKEKNQAD